ncbi:MAG: hypothetical protein MPN21_04510 [Thermoanaerobaculia bacterium]|nr:hypothetical protein [Thermoanaerobaculia bacterium]
MGRRLRHGLIALLLTWTVVQGLREPWRALQYHLADPWPATAPVLWTPHTHHVENLSLELQRLPLDDLGTIAVVTDASLVGEAWYQYLWLAYLLPEHDLIWSPDGAMDNLAEARLVLSGHIPRLELSP